MTAHPDELTINDYVDGALPPAAATPVAHHLTRCAQCRGLEADLRAIREAARELPPASPPPRVWEAIQRRIDPDAQARSTWTWRAVALAASVAIAVLVGWQWSTPRPEDTAARPSLAVPADAAIPPTVADVVAEFDAAFEGLEPIAEADRAVLDEVTLGAFDTSLAAVERAIDESRAAVATEPDNDYAQVSLIESFRMKLALLQDTVALINELRREPDSAPPGNTGS